MDILKLKASSGFSSGRAQQKSSTTTSEKSSFLTPALILKKDESKSENSKKPSLKNVPPPPPPPLPDVGPNAQYQIRQRVLQELLGEDALLSPLEPNIEPEVELDAALLDHMDEDMQEFQNSLVKEVIEKGMDLREYTSSLTDQLSKVEEELVRDYIASVPQLAELETKITSCEVFLEKMHTLLTGFQKNLGYVSKEIETLQSSNNQLRISWKNRSLLEEQLTEVIEQTFITPELITSILESEVNETYLIQIETLNKHMHYVKNNKGSRIRAFRDVGPELERLRNKSAERIRDFLMDKLKPLRQINTNIQMIQTNLLLKYTSLNLFLMQWHHEVSQEIRQHYVILVSKYYSLLVEKYIRGLQKRLLPVFERQDLIGVEVLSRDTTMMLNFLKVSSSMQASSASKSSKNVFNLAMRSTVLRDLNAPVIIVHIAEEQDLKFSLDHVFRSLTRMVLDMCSTEYAFCTEFFLNHRKDLGAPKAIASAVFQLITDTTLKLVAQSLELWFSLSFDILGILLCAQIHSCHRQLLAQRSIQIDFLNTFLDGIQESLLQRYIQLMDLHIGSMKRCRLTSKQIRLHFSTPRFTDLACAVFFLNLGSFIPKLLELRHAFEGFLQSSRAEYSSKQDGMAMLILNYDFVVSAFEEKVSPDEPLKSELAHWHKLLHHATMDYVDEALQPDFGYLLRFVNDTELALETTEVSAFERVSNQFNPTWRAILSSLSSDVMRTFSSAKYVSSVLQALLNQIVVHWERYHVLLDKKFKHAPVPFRNQPVGTQNLILEIKKYQTHY